MKIRIITLIALLTLVSSVFGQAIPISMKNEALYEFIDELASSRFIQVNQAIKPYSQDQVSEWLDEAKPYYQDMTKRQKDEWQFYRDNIVWHKEDSVSLANRIDLKHREFGALSLAPLGIFSTNGNVSIALKPIMNAQFMNNSNGTIYHRSYGAEFNLTVGDWGFYANLQDYAENEPFSKEDYLMNMNGGNYKGTDYSDMRGGVTYSNDWVSVGMVKDFLEWGTNQNGANIISDRAPSFSQIKLKITPVEWFEFNYVHGFLVSNVIDSAESYQLNNGEQRDIMHGKFLVSNMFTFYPFKSLTLSVGNSMVYSADNVKMQFVNPFMFYKSVDHTYNSTDGAGQNVGQNSQMFMDIGFRGIDHCFFYYSMLIDELKMERWKYADEYNHYSYKIGMKVTQLISDVSFGVEYTHTTPLTYQHFTETTTFASNDYNMGHYLGDNADEYYTYLHYRPIKNLRFKLSYSYARKGEEYGYPRVSDPDVAKHPFMEEVKYSNTTINLATEYQLAYDMFFNLTVGYSDVAGDDMETYMSPHFYGKQFNIKVGANIGF